MLFGLLTGSYDKNMSGGILRKIISNFKGEINATTGQFTSDATIVKNLNNLRIRDFNNGTSKYFYRKGSFRTGIMPEGDYVDWGNTIGEMMYEALRYYAGKSTPTAASRIRHHRTTRRSASRLPTGMIPMPIQERQRRNGAQSPTCW